jgi:Transglycosylase SLT domain
LVNELLYSRKSSAATTRLWPNTTQRAGKIDQSRYIPLVSERGHCVLGRLIGTVCVAAVLCLGTGSAVSAEGLNLSGSSKSQSSGKDSRFKLLDGRLATQYSDSVRLTPKGRKGAAADAVPRFSGSYKGEYLEVAKSAARKHGVPEDLFLRLIQQESGWNIGAVSNKGATGLAQLMPGTDDPAQNLDGGARYLRQMYDKFGTWKLALAAYNAGPGAVEQHDGIPPFDETITYVSAILG